MFDLDLSDLSPEQTLRLADDVEAAANRAEAGRLQAALRWADLHASVAHDAVAGSLPGMERLVLLGGDGTPEIAEFAPAELGARWSMSPGSASGYVGDALDLRHRLPRLWRQVLDGRVRAWVGRKVAQATRTTPAEVAAHVDRRASLWAASKSWWQLEAIVQAAIIEADPVAAAEAARDAELAQGVWVGRSTDHGVRDIHIRTDAASAIWFDASVDRVADGLGAFGDTDPKDVRRAKAVGVLAQPQQALDLFAAVASAHAAGPPSDPAPPTPDRARVEDRPKAVLYIHLSEDALARHRDGVARPEGVGPITADQARRWLSHCHVEVKPVIDLAGQVPADCYEVPDRMREAVLLRSPTDVFPHATSTARSRDLDHTINYVSPDDGGPPGQTHPGNLGPMSRRSHRIKTHGRWRVWQVDNGVFVWRSPHHDYYVVDHTGTHKVARARAPVGQPALN